MKKELKQLALCAIVALFSSCSSDTPSELAEKALTCMKNLDYKGLVDVKLMPGLKNVTSDPEIISERKAEWIEYYKELFENTEDDEKVKSFIIVSEIINEEAQTARVKYVLILKNDAKIGEMDFQLNKKGNWIFYF